MNFILLVASAAEIAIATIILWYVVDLLTTMPPNMRMVVKYLIILVAVLVVISMFLGQPILRWVSVGPCAYHTMKLGGTVPPPPCCQLIPGVLHVIQLPRIKCARNQTGLGRDSRTLPVLRCTQITQQTGEVSHRRKRVGAIRLVFHRLLHLPSPKCRRTCIVTTPVLIAVFARRIGERIGHAETRRVFLPNASSTTAIGAFWLPQIADKCYFGPEGTRGIF